ncbi:MAG TPA: relaxase/mobilization nuclease domain-containing protein [Chitinophagaceae bacterium]|nr:relaxase/mobilization nuclease domain-containing protein [Chitinophagaceae bacterium]
MISKVITGKTFGGACRYVCMDQKRAVVLETEGVRGYDHKLMAKDFEMQQAYRPSLKKAVFHGILSFYPGEKIEDKMMAEIAKKYLREMKIVDTQFAIVKHTDKNHSHLHIIANLVNNKGEAIKDSWIGLKGKKISQKLTLQYGLKEAVSKDLSLTNLEALNEKETNRYIIYQAISEELSNCQSLDELKQKLEQENIETLYKYKGQTNELQGISFKLGEFRYKGSEIDRKFSIGNLQKIIRQQQKESLLKRPGSIGSKLLSKNLRQEIKMDQKQDKSIIEELMKAEKKDLMVPHQWRLDKQQKKKKGLKS